MKSLFLINLPWRPLSSAKSKDKKIAVYICQMIPDTVVLVVLTLRTRWIWNFAGIIPKGEKWSPRSKRSSSFVLSARNFTRIGPVFNMGPRGDRPAICRLIRCTALAFAWNMYYITIQFLYHKEHNPGPLERTTGELFHLPALMHNSLFINKCMLHYYPRHVSSINMPIFRRTNCLHTASGIVALCKRLHSTPVDSRLLCSLLSTAVCKQLVLLKMGMLMLEKCRG